MRARYGRQPRGRWARALIIGAAVVALVAAGIGGWLLANPAVTASLLTYQVVSGQRADLTFEVTRPTSQPVTCVIRAQDEARHDVGYATVTVPAGPDYVHAGYQLATRARAVVVELLGCDVGGAPEVAAPQFPPGTANPPQRPTVAGG
ncbi:MAG TPA: DUF4307 domain-containing protein [Candidatus Nanopelagicales bacterium]|nr:DUF4307 domain-containing protein [Candidatus Nanopelagicales bacterium]